MLVGGDGLGISQIRWMRRQRIRLRMEAAVMTIWGAWRRTVAVAGVRSSRTKNRPRHAHSMTTLIMWTGTISSSLSVHTHTHTHTQNTTQHIKCFLCSSLFTSWILLIRQRVSGSFFLACFLVLFLGCVMSARPPHRHRGGRNTCCAVFSACVHTPCP